MRTRMTSTNVATSETRKRLPSWMTATKFPRTKRLHMKFSDSQGNNGTNVTSSDQTEEYSSFASLNGGLSEIKTSSPGCRVEVQDPPTSPVSDDSHVMAQATLLHDDHDAAQTVLGDDESGRQHAETLDRPTLVQCEDAATLRSDTDIVEMPTLVPAEPPVAALVPPAMPLSLGCTLKRATTGPYVRTHPGRLRLISLNARHATIELSGDGAPTSIMVGRASSNHPLATFADSKHVSACHCVFIVHGNEVRVLDRSSNGTFVNGVLVGKGQNRILEHGDEISLSARSANDARKDAALRSTFVSYVLEAV